MKEEKRSYIGGLLHGIGTLLTGMKITGREFFTPKVTEQFPVLHWKSLPVFAGVSSCRQTKTGTINVLPAGFVKWPVPTTPFISPAKHRLMKKQVRRKKHW